MKRPAVYKANIDNKHITIVDRYRQPYAKLCREMSRNFGKGRIDKVTRYQANFQESANS